MRKISNFYKNRLLFVRKYQVFLSLLIIFLINSISFPKTALALNYAEFNIRTSIGNISSIQTFFIFLVNLFRYFGWAAVVFGVVTAIAMLIYKLIFADDNEAMKKVQAGMTKAVAIVVIGIVMVGAGFILSVIAKLFGISTNLWTIPAQLG